MKDRRNERVQVCTKLQQVIAEGPTFLSKTTGSKRWMYGCETKIKQQSSQFKTLTSP